eukprot:CAMPEP_0184970710 /NCGR_PEP_ID=MMETSP1098-20130426/3076_1 /TAXON_ID=89044 /ORGANISM="Spumella elongata, Strain CCAP 955/1" /LENGTH=1410 /DNA_ID=CAMNT_0027492679 /DNA_START=68 /DNA_END=4303 /DNA_ORIENTATION=+
MFTLFKSKKQKSELKKIEKLDSFYEAEDDDDLNLGNNTEMSDAEYNRKVTEEITKRKSLAKAVPVPKASPVSSKAATANAFSSKSPVNNISPVAKGVASTKNGFVAAPSPKTAPVSQRNTPAKTSASSTPVSSRPNTAPSTPVTSAASPRPDGFATPALVRASNVASRPNSATSTPRTIPSRNGFVADTKGLQQLVSMGFSYPASTLALMKNDNRIDLATEYLLERSDDEINKLLALEAAGAVNSAKKAAQSASAPPSPARASAPDAVAVPASSQLKRELSPRSASKKAKNLSIQTGPQSEESAPSKSPATLARVPSARLNPGHAAANTAMAAILAKRDAAKKTDSDKKPNGTSPAPGDGPSTPSPARESSFDRLSNYKTKGQILREQKAEENRRHDEAQEARRKTLREMALANKESPGGVLGSPASPGNPSVPVLENSAFESLHLKKTKSMQLAEEINEAKRAEKAEKDKELQERPLLVRQASSVLKRQASADFSAANSVITTFTPVADPKAFENLYKKKTHAMLLAERAEEMQREEIEAHRAELQAQAARRKLLRDASPGSTRMRANSSDTITTCSTLNKSGTFDSLYATKTRSQQLADEDEAKRRRQKEAQDRKWKLAVTPRSSFNGTASDNVSVLTQENNEVFEKLYAKKRVSQEIGEKVAMEEKVHREKVEARESGKSGSALPEASPTALLKKTKSMYLREQLMGEERQQREEVRSAEKELILAPRNNPRARAESNDGSNTARRSLMSASDDSALSELTPFSVYREHSSTSMRTGNLLDGIGATMVDDEFDSEDEDDRMPSLNVAERPANHARNSPSTQMQHKNSDFFKFGQSFYGSESKSFRSSKNNASSFRKSEGGNANSASRRAMVATRIEDIKGIVRRTTLPSEVLETSDHSWNGKVTIPANPILGLPQVVETLKGMFESKAQCEAITAAYAPPVMADSKKKTACKVCEEAFNKYLKPEHCHNCGQMVCADCSDESWPRSMLPHTYFSEKKGKARVCSACNQLMEKLVTALKAGNMDEVIALHEIGNVNFHFPLTVYPDAPYPIHCAAGSGNVGLLEWLVEKQHCPTKDFRTGEPLMNAAGHTILAVAARKGDVTMMGYCLHHLHSSVQEITDIAALQRGLHAALESPGPMPSIGFKKPPKSPLVTPSTSFRRYESNDISAHEETATVPDTGSLQEKAADLAEKLKAAQAAQAPADTAGEGNSESLATLAGNLVSSLESAQEDAAAIVALANGASSGADPSVNQPPVFESEVSLEFASMAPSSSSAAESTTASSAAASGLAIEVGPTSTGSTDAESSTDPNSFSVNHRGLAVRSLSASNVHTAVSARGEQNQSHSFVTGPKRMNSTKVEPVEDEGPKSRITLPRSPSAQNSTLQAEIQAAARAEVKEGAKGETEMKVAVVA